MNRVNQLIKEIDKLITERNSLDKEIIKLSNTLNRSDKFIYPTREITGRRGGFDEEYQVTVTFPLPDGAVKTFTSYDNNGVSLSKAEVLQVAKNRDLYSSDTHLKMYLDTISLNKINAVLTFLN